MTAYALLCRRASEVSAVEVAESQSIRERRASLRVLVGRTGKRQTPRLKAAHPAADDKVESGRVSSTRSAQDGRTLEEESDQQLLIRYRCGSEAAFRTLYRRYYQKARALALTLTRNENDACEVAQEAFVRVLRRLGHFEGQSAFYTWLYRIVHNLSIDCLRRPYKKRVPIEQVERWLGDLAPLGLPAIRAADPFEACVGTELGRHIAVAIEGLPLHHRAVIEMREVNGMSYAEMADALGCSKGTVMSRLFHARHRLQEQLRGTRAEVGGTADAT